jgi:hypothetical protein
MEGHATIKAVTRLYHAAATTVKTCGICGEHSGTGGRSPQIYPRSIHVGFVVNKVAMEADQLQVYPRSSYVGFVVNEVALEAGQVMWDL